MTTFGANPDVEGPLRVQIDSTSGRPSVGRWCCYLLAELRVLRRLPVLAGLTSHVITGGESMDARGDARFPVHESRGSGAGTRKASDNSITRRSAKPIGR